jgi:hypothetical protein
VTGLDPFADSDEASRGACPASVGIGKSWAEAKLVEAGRISLDERRLSDTLFSDVFAYRLSLIFGEGV